MPQNSSARYFQDNKERLQIKARGRYQSLSKKKKRESDNMVLKDRNICWKMKRKNQKTKYEKKRRVIIERNYFYLENLFFLRVGLGEEAS